MSKRVSNEKYQDRIEKKYPGKYTFLSKYVDSKTKVHIRHNKCGHDDWVMPRYLTSGTGCGVCRPSKPLNTEYIKKYISDNFDGYSLVSEYTNNRTSVVVEHNCGKKFPIMPETFLYRNNCNCPLCTNLSHLCVTDCNDIHTTDVWLFNLLANKEDGYNYSSGSNKYVDFICPGCGDIINQKIYSVWKFGVNCPKCRTSISYPERFFGNVLDQLGIDSIFQFSPGWSGRCRYDFRPYIGDEKYIVELDGGFHYEDNNLSGKTVEEQIEDDIYKQQMAEEHGFTVIRIDCDYGGNDRFKYVRDHILQSELSKIIDFSSVDFELCNIEATKQLAKIVADAWNEGGKTVNDLCNELNLSDTTIWKRLKDAYMNGMIKDDPEKIKLINRKAAYKKYGYPRLNIIKCNETGEIFEGYKEPSKKYHANIANYFRDERRKFAGTLQDGTRLTWTKL